MRNVSKRPTGLLLFAMLAAPAWASLSAQQLAPVTGEDQINVYGSVPSDLSGLPEGPEIEGIISARRGNEIQVTTNAGSNSMFALSPATEIRGRGGFLGLNRTEITGASLPTGLPVTVQTVQWEGGLVASEIRFKSRNLETAAMIHGGTAQRFAEHDTAIAENAAATEALRGRVANIDQYNIMGTTNVYFDTGKWNLSSAAENDLCAAASEANGTDNALLLVVGYTDSVGDEDYNQVLSERRAGRVVNFLQQKCSWAPWRMLTPTGMSESDPLADNETEEGRAQNRRVSVNILVSKALDGL